MIPADMRDDMQALQAEAPVPPEAGSTPEAPVRRKKKGMSQERIMIALTLFFVLGIAVCVQFEEGMTRGIALTLVSLGSYWIMFKGGA